MSTTHSAYLADLARYTEPTARLTPARALTAFSKSYGLKALLAYRLGRWLLRAPRNPLLWPALPAGWLVYFLLSRYVRAAYGIHLSLSAVIGPGLHIDHLGDIVVRNCQIGRGCSIKQCVHLAPVAGGPGPVIGDEVWIGANARVVGAFRIGDAATVSAGSVVGRDVPPKSLYVGSPGRVVWRGYENRSLHDTAYLGI